MLDMFLLMLFMIVIGAFIGAMTNFIAIRMLFRPHQPIFIGKWQLPFTPGLIPKRRDEIAHQLGNIVVDHLLTANGLTKKIKSESKKWTEHLQQMVRHWLQTDQSIEQIACRFLEIDVSLLLKERAENYLSVQYDLLFKRYRSKTIEQCLTPAFSAKIEENIPIVADYLLQRGKDFLESADGKKRLRIMIDRFIEQKGKLGNMISMFISQDKLLELVEKELVKLLNDETTKRELTNICQAEWNRLKEKPLSSFEQYVKREEVVNRVMHIFDNELSLFERLSQPLNEWAPTYEKQLLSVVPKVVELGIDTVTNRIDTILKELKLQEIVTEQVQSFSTERLEVLIVSIAKRELTMITYFGALLGGVIGLVQSFFVVFF